MRSYKDPSDFFRKMKKKPELQSIIDNLDLYSDDDIMNFNQPLWIRKELINLRKRNGLSKEQAVEQFANKFEITIQKDECKEVREWIGPLDQLSFGNGSSFDISAGNLLFLMPETNEIRIDFILVKLNYSQWQVMLNNSSTIGYMNYLDYRTKINEYLNKKYR